MPKRSKPFTFWPGCPCVMWRCVMWRPVTDDVFERIGIILRGSQSLLCAKQNYCDKYRLFSTGCFVVRFLFCLLFRGSLHLFLLTRFDRKTAIVFAYRTSIALSRSCKTGSRGRARIRELTRAELQTSTGARQPRNTGISWVRWQVLAFRGRGGTAAERR